VKKLILQPHSSRLGRFLTRSVAAIRRRVVKSQVEMVCSYSIETDESRSNKM